MRVQNTTAAGERIEHRRLGLAEIGEFRWLLPLAAFAGMTALLEVPALIRMPFGMLLVLVLPGYALTAALFPRNNAIDFLERGVMSIVFSVALVPLLTLGIEFSVVQLTPAPIVTALLLTTGVASIIAILRRSTLEPGERFTLRFSLPGIPAPSQWSPTTKWGMNILAVAVLLFSVSGLTLIITQARGETMTEFAVYNTAGDPEFYPREFTVDEPQTVLLEVTNEEGQSEEYGIRVLSDGTEIEVIQPFQVTSGSTWRQEVDIYVLEPGEFIPIEFELYRDSSESSDSPYRTLRLLVEGQPDYALD